MLATVVKPHRPALHFNCSPPLPNRKSDSQPSSPPPDPSPSRCPHSPSLLPDPIKQLSFLPYRTLGIMISAGHLPHLCTWPFQVMCDPMAGSGTLAVEAALIATDTAPGLLRTRPPLARQGWLEGEMVQWESLLSEARSLQRPEAPLPILANDMCAIWKVTSRTRRLFTACFG